MVGLGIAAATDTAAKASQTQKSVTVTKATLSSTEVAATNAKTDEVVSISKSMEKLLDGFTGAGGKAPANDADAADQNAGSATDKPASGKGGYKSAALDHARAGAQAIDKVLSNRDDFADRLSQALDQLKSGLGSTLEAFGLSKSKIDDVVSGFGKHLDQQAKTIDFSQLAVSAQSSSTQFTIESHGIDLVVQDGDRELKISYAKSTLELHRQDSSLQAQFGADGSGAVAVGASTTDADGKAEGMIINAKGFSAEEIESVLGKLNELQSKGGAGGLSVLTPQTKGDGILKLKLDLSAVLPEASQSASAATSSAATPSTAAAGSSLNITA